MPFTTGFLGGFTLTTSLLYYTLWSHQQNRLHQRSLLRQQAALLSLSTAPAREAAAAAAGRRRARPERMEGGLVETAKGRWNDEVRRGVEWVRAVDWSEEGRVLGARIWKLVSSEEGK